MHGRLTVIGAALLLAACGGGDAAEDSAVAEGGEVLEGTASDAMLPIATVTSQPPLAPEEPDRRGPAAAATPTSEVTSPASAPTGAADSSDTSAETASN